MPMPRKDIDVDHLIDLYTSGMPVAEIEDEFDASLATLYKRLHEAGVPLRGPGSPPNPTGPGHPRWVDVDIDAIVDAYCGGESVKSISNRTGHSRPTITRRLKGAGVKVRGRSEAERLKWEKIKERGRSAVELQVSDAWEARRGSTDSLATKIRRAQTRYRRLTHSGNFEATLSYLLSDLGYPIERQYPVKCYNLDLAVPALSVAVEVVGSHVSPSYIPTLQKRTEDLLDRDWTIIFTVIFTVEIPDLAAVADQTDALIQRFGGDEPVRGSYWVVGGHGEVSAGPCADVNDLPSIFRT